ncbi:hypothetical protein [Coxiella-like endosymbiont]|uniref:hypothetical protein n=1 Tax=Coxiella-like endosymbiont TaxID=1592897 RepID=UPI00272D64A0|nr:hypothetical protein [Coxiella-like endosymbiont]
MLIFNKIATVGSYEEVEYFPIPPVFPVFIFKGNLDMPGTEKKFTYQIFVGIIQGGSLRPSAILKMTKVDLQQELLLDINGTVLLSLKLVRIIYQNALFRFPWIAKSHPGGIIKEISWNAYIALKFIIPIYHNFFIPLVNSAR